MRRKWSRHSETQPQVFQLRSEEATNQTSSEVKSEWLAGACRLGLCPGAGVACKDGPAAMPPSHKCVCTSDHSTPGPGENPCRRRVVPTNPRPIKNIIPPAAVSNKSSIFNITQNSTSVDGTMPEVLMARSNFEGNAIAIILASICLSAICAAAFCWWKRSTISNCANGDKQRKQQSELSPLSLSKGLMGNYISNPQYAPGSPELTMPVPVLQREKLVFIQDIGEGCFGKVFKGEFYTENAGPETVAVKILKDGASQQAEEDFMREVEIMSTFRHENILTLLGIVLKEPGGRPWMVFEFMPHGDLAELLRNNSKQLWKPTPGLDPLTKRDMVWIALQIAGGMRYLAAQRFVHNDLACRNCLVGNGLTVKIADFGMSRDVYTCDYYRIGGSRPVPLRWMSPESVMYRRFTLESDVWSYGVVLWEIFSLGMQPYFGLTNEEVVKHILQGILLIPPHACPPLACDLMRACWKTEPRDRIRFAEIHEKLEKAVEEDDKLVGGASEVSLPRPPVLPVADISDSHLMDIDNYLVPKAGVTPEYLLPIAD